MLKDFNDFEKLYIGDDSVWEFSTPTKVVCGDSTIGYLIPNTSGVVEINMSNIIPSLNIQTSRYHKETLMDHVAMVVARVSNETDGNELAILIAMFHDIAKKYTIAFNDLHDICYYNHEEISADLTMSMLTTEFEGTDILRDLGAKYLDYDYPTNVQTLDAMHAIITNHLNLKTIKNRAALDLFKVGFLVKYGQSAFDILAVLDRADVGVTYECPLNEEDQKLVNDGNVIIRNMIEKYFGTNE